MIFFVRTGESLKTRAAAATGRAEVSYRSSTINRRGGGRQDAGGGAEVERGCEDQDEDAKCEG